ncbi:MDR family MFS transporter [Pediococcus claussenii]|uniref:MDR family MFS transporter n=1 Tax=Pediococcus claussenii TaxID=187452 RepID=UPI00081A6DBE|nr:MFS transporter [Pediococcus claussenii]ANZ69576.1 MFS transporter permease [Pediococcus claussenii]ANZ71393.1 MFS transporter permease [Pediococcus claussenii]
MRELRLKWLLLGALIDSTAMSSVWPLTTIYMNQELGHSLVAAGVVLFLNSVASIIGSYVAGRLYDKYDSYYLMLGAIVFTWLSMLILIFWNGWPIYPIMLVLIGFGTGWIATISNSLGTTIRNHDGRYVFNMLYFVQNLGVMLGTALVGVIFKHSVAPLFMIAVGIFTIFFFVALFTYRVSDEVQHHRVENKDVQQDGFATKQGVTAIPKANVVIIMSLLFSLLIMWVFYQQWNSTIPIYMLKLHIPLREYSFLWTVNGFFILVVQGLLSSVGGRIFKDPYHQVYFGIFFILASFGILAVASAYIHFVLAMIVLTIGEAIAFPSIPAIVNILSPYDQKGKYQGLTSSFPSAGRSVGPLIGSALVEATSFVALYAVGMVAILVVLVAIIFIIDMNKRRTTKFE